MNILFHLTKNKKYYEIIFILLLCYSCQEKNNINKNIEKAFVEYGHQDMAIIYREKSNQNIPNSEKFIFLTGPELLKNRNENFFLLGVLENENKMTINIYSFTTGKSLTCYFENDVLKSTEEEDIKIGESKPFYIYYEIMKRKYPKYMNWDLFPIPKDSLK